MRYFRTFKNLLGLFTAFNFSLRFDKFLFWYYAEYLDPRKASLVPLDFIHVKQPNLIIFKLNSQQTAVWEWERCKTNLYDSDDDDYGLALY